MILTMRPHCIMIKILNIFIIIKRDHLRICTVGVMGYIHAHESF